MMLTRGWPFRGPAAGEPPPMASAMNKEISLSAIGAIGHGQRNRDSRNQSGNPSPGRKLTIGAKQTAVVGR